MVDHTRRSVQRTYDRIGEHFAATRASPWPEVEAFCADRTAGQAIDIGCGNGRHASLLAETGAEVLALDASRTMLQTARKRVGSAASICLVAGDAVRLPVRSGVFDLATYVATIQHLPSRDQRRRSLAELARVLRSDGVALVSAWSTTHEAFDREVGFDTTREWVLPDGSTVDRYYHIHDPEEFDDLLAESSLAVGRSWTSSGNCYAIVGGSPEADASDAEGQAS